MAASTPIPDPFSHPVPVFRVTSVSASVDYYVTKLGFKLLWQYNEGFASVARGKTNFFLTEGDQGHCGTWVWIGVPDVDALHAELAALGATIRNPPTEYPWAREMQVADPDNNVLRIGSDPTPGAPPGPWLDMYGDRWITTPEGNSIKVAE